MTGQCRPGQSNCCRLCPSHRYEVQYKDGEDWIVYGYTKADTGWPLKEELEAEGKEVKVKDTEVEDGAE